MTHGGDLIGSSHEHFHLRHMALNISQSNDLRVYGQSGVRLDVDQQASRCQQRQSIKF